MNISGLYAVRKEEHRGHCHAAIGCKNEINCDYYLHRCGEGLRQLLNDVEVQSLLHGTTTTAQNGDKAIYQPGALRKVWIYEAYDIN